MFTNVWVCAWLGWTMKLPPSDGLLVIEWFREGNWKVPEEAGRLNKVGFSTELIKTESAFVSLEF